MPKRSLIEPAKGSWSSPIVLAKKKYGSSSHEMGCATVTSDRCKPGCFSRCQVVHDIRLSVELLLNSIGQTRTLKAMPFGLCNAPGTEEERLFRLKEVFQRVKKLKLKKVLIGEETAGLPQACHHFCGNRDIPTKDSGK
ncbi:hypothetical protein T4A_1463 [Trichinella pseudospiralis]|uniref:Uncharacterized protein n=1 Tax=Trichinella pseudospiralis TaxID=6337 RepID=A0A0V1EAV9_TRIPS|nr:hypothetical protein T4A_1463 [Trichinella pseudospiralis]